MSMSRSTGLHLFPSIYHNYEGYEGCFESPRSLKRLCYTISRGLRGCHLHLYTLLTRVRGCYLHLYEGLRGYPRISLRGYEGRTRATHENHHESANETLVNRSRGYILRGFYEGPSYLVTRDPRNGIRGLRGLRGFGQL